MTKEERRAQITRVLEGWFGESLEDSESEAQHRRYLYEPLWKAAEEIYKAGRTDQKTIMCNSGDTQLENELATKRNPQPRFTYWDYNSNGAFWSVYDNLIQTDVFWWRGTGGEEKCSVVTEALNSLERTKQGSK